MQLFKKLHIMGKLLRYSSLTKKFIMALAGAFLMVFLVTLIMGIRRR